MEQLKVTKIARSLKPPLLLSATPSALDGPPIVAPDTHGRPIALGGNGRTMALRLVFQRGGKQAKAYAAALGKLLRRKVPAGTILVRELLPPPPAAEWARWSRDLNRPLGAGLGLTAQAVSLVFYLRHRARGDECLIIDEPQLNLHPDNQRKVARILAKLVNRGMKMIVSTHSDYLIRELNNLIMLSQDTEEARQLTRELGLQLEMLLRPDKLGVYLFEPNGSSAEVPVTDYGFEVKTIDDEIHALNHDAQTIYSSLFSEQ